MYLIGISLLYIVLELFFVSSENMIAKTLEKVNSHIYVLESKFPARVLNINLLVEVLEFSQRDADKYITRVPTVDKSDIWFEKKSFKDEIFSWGFVTPNYFNGSLYARATRRDNRPGSKPINEKEKKRNAGRLACFLSHVKAYRLFVASNYSSALIFEDDAQFAPTNELQLIYGMLDANHGKLVSKVEDLRKQRVLLERMLLLDSKLWDLQYLGFCFECGGNSEQFPFHAAKQHYLWHGIDAFLTNATSELQATNMYNSYYFDAIMPQCAHSYVINRHFLSLYFQENLNPKIKDHLSSDGLMAYILCKYKLKKVRSIIPIFYQADANVSLIANKFHKVHEKPSVSCIELKQSCEKLYAGSVV